MPVTRYRHRRAVTGYANVRQPYSILTIAPPGFGTVANRAAGLMKIKQHDSVGETAVPACSQHGILKGLETGYGIQTSS